MPITEITSTRQTSTRTGTNRICDRSPARPDIHGSLTARRRTCSTGPGASSSTRQASNARMARQTISQPTPIM